MKVFSLSRNEKVKRKNDFKKVYSSKKILFSSDLLVKSHYTIDLDEQIVGAKIAVAVSTKAGQAVWRNRIKRLIRESYRLNKHALLKKTIEKKICLLIIFSPNKLSENNNKKVYYNDICSSVIELINKIEQQI